MTKSRAQLPISAIVLLASFIIIIGMALMWSASGNERHTQVTYNQQPRPTPSSVFVPLGYCDKMGCVSYTNP